MVNKKKILRRKLCIALLAKTYLHYNGFTSDGENDKIFKRISKFQNDLEIKVTSAQIDSANFTYNDRAKEVKDENK